MRKKRKQCSSDVKVKVALAAIRGDETVLQLAARRGLHRVIGQRTVERDFLVRKLNH